MFWSITHDVDVQNYTTVPHQEFILTELPLLSYLDSVGHILGVRVRNAYFKFFEKNIDKIQQNMNNFFVYFGLYIMK